MNSLPDFLRTLRDAVAVVFIATPALFCLLLVGGYILALMWALIEGIATWL